MSLSSLCREGVVLGIIADAQRHGCYRTRKISAPDNEEYAIGALTEDGGVVWNEIEKERYGDEI